MVLFVKFRIYILLVGLLLTNIALGNNSEINEAIPYDSLGRINYLDKTNFQHGYSSPFSSLPYDLTVGTPDDNGVLYATIFASRKVTFKEPISYMGKLVSSYKSWSDGPSLYTATPEVKGVWKDGWTGKGVNILLVDSYIDEETSFHGVTTMMITDLVAPGASKYGLDFNFNSWANLVKDIDGYNIDSYKSMGVVNASFGFNYWRFWLDPNVEEDVELAFYSVYKEQKQNLTWDSVFNGTTLIKNLDLSDAVIVKAAGNDSTSSANEPFDYIYATDANINPRLLIVGATVSDGTVDEPTSLASYSNFAGLDMEIANRFLVANGASPYDTGDLSIDGYKMSKGYGTSYAAPRVAGYVAILRQKFPNLNAEQSASILLETARYDTLSCYPVCPVYIYGKGEASISRALAPVGKLH